MNRASEFIARLVVAFVWDVLDAGRNALDIGGRWARITGSDDE